MAYYTDTVNSFAALKTAIEAHLVANGYSITSDVISKNSCFYKLTASTSELVLTAGVGQSGSTLTTPAPGGAKVWNCLSDPFVFPITYECFINSSPDEVAIVLALGGGRYQQLFFGKSDMLGLTGPGTWITGSAGTSEVNGTGLTIAYQSSGGINATGNSIGAKGPFCEQYFSGGSPRKSSYILVGPATWIPTNAIGGTGPVDGDVSFVVGTGEMYPRTPNAFNQGTVLFPIYVNYFVSGNRSQIVVEPRTLRRCKINNYLPGDVVSFAGEDWKLYPLYRKDMTAPDAASGVLNTGAHGYAVRYAP